MRKSKILRRIYGNAWENRDWGGIIGMTLVLIALLGPMALLWVVVIQDIFS